MTRPMEWHLQVLIGFMAMLMACGQSEKTLTPGAPTELRLEHVESKHVIGMDVRIPRFSWQLAHSRRGERQSAFQISVSQANGSLWWDSGKQPSSQSEGVEYGMSYGAAMALAARQLEEDQAYTWSVRWWDSLDTDSNWSEAFPFSTGLLQAVDWDGAEWLNAGPSDLFGGPPPAADATGLQLRANFQIPEEAARATLFIVGIGYYRCWINGQAVSDHELGHVTTFERTVLYDSFDVTKLLNAPGQQNAIGCAVANGWADGTDMASLHLHRALLLQLSVRSPDGSRATFVSSTSAQPKTNSDAAFRILSSGWSTNPGPYLQAAIFQGVTYDARLETPGWTTAAFDPGNAWTAAKAAAAPPRGKLRASLAPLIRKAEAFPAQSMVHIGGSDAASMSYIFDFGQNAAAMIELQVPAPPTSLDRAVAPRDGATYTFRITFAETLKSPTSLGPLLSNGDVVYTIEAAELARRWQEQLPTLFAPSFTFAGFQYAKLNISASVAIPLPKPTLTTLTSRFVHSDVRSAGEVSFSVPLLDTLQRVTRLTSLSNLMDVPTDCPTRERAGWVGDGHLTSETTSFNFDMAAFYTKWLNDIADAQVTYRDHCASKDCECNTYNCTGEVPPVAPFYGHGYHGGTWTGHGTKVYPGTDPTWGMGFTVITHHLWRWHGDLRAVRENFDRLELYMEYLGKLPGVSGLPTYNVFNDWDPPKASKTNSLAVEAKGPVPDPVLGPRGVPSPLLTGWAYIRQLRMMSELAAALQRDGDAVFYAKKAESAAAVFLEAYVRHNATSGLQSFFDGGAIPLQSANAIGLQLFEDPALAALLPDDVRKGATAQLVSSTLDYQNHSFSGILGQNALFPVLGAHTLPVPMLDARHNEFSAASGSALALSMNVQTTYPSLGNTIARGATTLWEEYDGSMSHNHIMYGTQSAWYFQSLAGITMQPAATSAQAEPASGWQRILLHPKVSCEYLASHLNLSSVHASVNTSRGIVRSSWQLHACPAIPLPPVPPAPSKVCGVSSAVVELDCGAGRSVSSVDFADFGLPSGSCDAGFASNASCSAAITFNNSAAIAAEACVGKQMCEISANTAVFGEPCFGVHKRLVVIASCGDPAPSPPGPSPRPPPVGPRHFDWTVSIPTGSEALVRVPLLGAAPGAVTITVDGSTANGKRATVWAQGAFVPGAASGVDDGMALKDSVEFACGSGDYAFELQEETELLV